MKNDLIRIQVHTHTLGIY